MVKISVEKRRRKTGFVWVARWCLHGKHHGRALGSTAKARDAALEALRAELASGQQGREATPTDALEGFLH